MDKELHDIDLISNGEVSANYGGKYDWIVDHGTPYSKDHTEPSLKSMEEFVNNMGFIGDLFVRGCLIYKWKGIEEGAYPRFRMYTDEEVKDILIELHRDEIAKLLAKRDKTF